MNMLRYVSAAFLLATLCACKVVIEPPEGGEVLFANGSACSAGETCTFDVRDTNFDEKYRATPLPGWEFVGWKKGPRQLCGGSKDPICHLFTDTLKGNRNLEAVLASNERFYLTPEFAPVTQGGWLDFRIDFHAPTIVRLNEPTEVTFTITNISDTPKKSIGGIAAWLQLEGYFGNRQPIDGWSFESGGLDCFYHPGNIASALHSDQGNAVQCSEPPALGSGESASYRVAFTPVELAVHTIAFTHNRLRSHFDVVVTPPIVDTDNDGAIDFEEEIFGSNPFNGARLPAITQLNLMLFYTPEFAAKYPTKATRDLFFEGFTEHANNVLASSEVRVRLRVVETRLVTPIADPPPPSHAHYLWLQRSLETGANGFEYANEDLSNRDVHIYGVVDNHDDVSKGYTTKIKSGFPNGYFSSNDTYQSMLWQIAQILGAGRTYTFETLRSRQSHHRESTYNFAFAYRSAAGGSILSRPPGIDREFISNPHIRNCGLILCGVRGEDPTVAANNAQAMNLRRYWLANSNSGRNDDSDFDGMSDPWEKNRTNTTAQDRCDDPDRDGHPNYLEFLSNTDPRDANSVPSGDHSDLQCERPADQTIRLVAERGKYNRIDLRLKDAEGYLFQTELARLPTRGSLYKAGAGHYGVYFYKPSFGFIGTDKVEVYIYNGIGGFGRATVLIEVK